MKLVMGKLAARALFCAIAIGLGAATAEARCVRLGFSVNDYGKDGPTKDAKSLLDKHIAKWTAERGIAKYTTGKKDVKCELFLDFGVFDEHTCRAEATVCYPDGAGGAPIKAKATDTPASGPAKAKAPAKAAKPAPDAAPKAPAPATPAPPRAKPNAA